jgi:hypothetical protein
MKIYLTGQFLLPILGLYSYKVAHSPRLRQVARRTLSMSHMVQAKISWHDRHTLFKYREYQRCLRPQRPRARIRMGLPHSFLRRSVSRVVPRM